MASTTSIRWNFSLRSPKIGGVTRRTVVPSTWSSSSTSTFVGTCPARWTSNVPLGCSVTRGRVGTASKTRSPFGRRSGAP